MPAPPSAMADAISSTVGVLAQGLARFAYTALIGRVLGAGDLAAVNLAFSIAILLSLVWPTGAGNAAAAYARPGQASADLRARLMRSVAVSLAFLTPLAVVVAVVIGLSWAAAALAGLLTLAWSSYIFTRGLRMGLGQVRQAATWDVISGLFAIALLAATLWLRLDAWLLAPAILGYVSFAIASLLASRRSLGSGDDPPHGIPALRSTIAWSSASLIASNGLMQVTMVIAYGFDAPSEAGLFAAAISLATPLSMVAQAVTQALLPRFLGWRSLGPRAESRQMRRTSLALAVVIAAGCAVVVALLPWGLPLVYGAAFTGAVPIAQFLMIAVLGFSLSVFFAAYLSAVGRARAATIATAIASMTGLATMLAAGITIGGVAGAVIGAGVGMSLAAALLAFLALRRSPLG